MGPINFIKRVLGFPTKWEMCDYLGDEIFIEVFHPNSYGFHFKWSNFHFKWSKASNNLKYACLMYPGLEDELKLLQCVNPEMTRIRYKDEKKKSMGCQFYSMTDFIRDAYYLIKIDTKIDTVVLFSEFNVDNLPLSHLPISIALFMRWHNNRVEELSENHI